MKIQGAGYVHSPQAIQPSTRASGAASAAPTQGLAEADQLDISAAGELASHALDGPSRTQRIAQIRAAIQDGTYETDEKLGVALDRLLDKMG